MVDLGDARILVGPDLGTSAARAGFDWRTGSCRTRGRTSDYRTQSRSGMIRPVAPAADMYRLSAVTKVAEALSRAVA